MPRAAPAIEATLLSITYLRDYFHLYAVLKLQAGTARAAGCCWS